MSDLAVSIPTEKGSNDSRNLCWSCRSEVREEPLCPTCVKLQPLGRSSDYFSVMGVPRKLGLDPKVLEPVFHALSRRFHPDVYRMASPRERIIALENSALLNQAYRTLRDPFERTSYLVQLEQGRASEAAESPPGALFEEILEAQELLGEYKFGDEEEERAVLRARIEAQRDMFRSEQESRARALTGRIFPDWDALQDQPQADPQRRAALLAEMSRLLGERSYLKRVLNSLDEALSH